jgi:hypothetical protein
MLTREKLVNITVFMRYAAEAGKLQNVRDVMAFAETLQAVDTEIKALDANSNKPAGDAE